MYCSIEIAYNQYIPTFYVCGSGEYESDSTSSSSKRYMEKTIDLAASKSNPSVSADKDDGGAKEQLSGSLRVTIVTGAMSRI